MSRIVIVEDRLMRTVSLANQFDQLREEHPDWGIRDIVICFFCEQPVESEADIRAARDSCRYRIENINMINFDKIMDTYMEDKDTFFVIDFVLNGDGSNWVSADRINIRYARDKDRYKSNRLWFYTGTGDENEKLLHHFFGDEHVLSVAKVDDRVLKLELNGTVFCKALGGIQTDTKLDNNIAGPEVVFSTMDNLNDYNEKLLSEFVQYVNERHRSLHDVFYCGTTVQMSESRDLIADFLQCVKLE